MCVARRAKIGVAKAFEHIREGVYKPQCSKYVGQERYTAITEIILVKTLINRKISNFTPQSLRQEVARRDPKRGGKTFLPLSNKAEKVCR